MEIEAKLKELHPLEVKVLRRFSPGEDVTREGMTALFDNASHCNQAVSWLSAKGFLAETGRSSRTVYELGELGQEYLAKGSLEKRIVTLLGEAGPLALPAIAERLGVEAKDVGSAFGGLAKEGALAMDAEKRAILKDASKAVSVTRLTALLARFAGTKTIEESALSPEEKETAASNARKRGSSRAILRAAEREDVTWRLTPAGAEARRGLERLGMTGEETGALTPEMLKTGSWKGKSFRHYNTTVPPVRILAGRRNPYCSFLERLKDKLASLGFEEFDGPLVETDFWNCDALFMPQFHSARDIHDVYHVKDPVRAGTIEQPYLDRVAAAHENGWTTGSRGWGYRFDRDFTRRLVLRSQGTVLSAKTLPHARVPGKYFGVVRCFRYDKVDATHLADFYQTEGIVLGEEVNLRTLLGLLKMFAEEVAGAKEVKYVPGFFPYTEPSVEVHIKHPTLGWFELGGSGIFRPEVTEPLGVKVPVLAWGLGIDRMAMMSMGIRDIRELFTPEIESVRTRRAR
jgi:phenylalanyl-tRNA synthetase alpha chain